MNLPQAIYVYFIATWQSAFNISVKFFDKNDVHYILYNIIEMKEIS